ncbi:hypothetical protein H6F42_09145 [Pseudanabaena sp. FACHB-1998]|uniref:hypothetical protein n=1 Tax=Pseudanabaena sp. FACHB-1998 TaxID=2692858 RepID=UPI00168140C9|nr:hypothetical protein [Pseudanabaena sp. FACHB-1998]MBD2177075.1 hypothetical protein [Pseudanabaena sp. FACHB-1998]
MTQPHLQKVRVLRQQIIAETKHGFADWQLVQKLLDELMENHQQYKEFAAKENTTLYNYSELIQE